MKLLSRACHQAPLTLIYAMAWCRQATRHCLIKKKSIDFESANIRDHNAQLQDLKAKFEHREDEVERANSAIATMESEINSLERHTRGFNIRILGVAEHDGEDCIGRVQELLSDYLNVSEPVIENAHRVGVSRAGKPRQLIARFHSRHYDLCPVDSCVNLLSALDSRNGVMSMRTSPHLRALLINNNPCGQQFS